jgi:hypothetical protein
MSEWSIEHAWKTKLANDTKRFDERQRTRDQRLSLLELPSGVRP